MTADYDLRIVHVSNFHYNRHGDKYDTMDAKIHHGLIENGHYVYAFPFHDIARQNSWRNNKRAGSKKAGKSLIITCLKVQPDILLLGHTQTVDRATIEIIKEKIPGIKIAQWFCDWLYTEKLKSYQFIYDRLDLLDHFFATTAGSHLENFNQKGCQTTFIPNPIHPAVERYMAFNATSHKYDLVFIGTDLKDPERSDILRKIETKLGSKYKIGIFGSLGHAPAYGYVKEKILSQSKAALNLSRLPEAMKWYSSDRITSVMGNGLLNCTHADAALSTLYGSDSLLEYEDTSDLSDKFEEALSTAQWKVTAERGWQISHDLFSSKKVAAYVIDTVLGNTRTAPWSHLNASSPAAPNTNQ
jgi:hypothetical protein